MAASLSKRPSSMLTSMICAPASTCCRATARASSNLLLSINLEKALEPVTLVRSPTLTNNNSGLKTKGSIPDKVV